MRPALDGQVEFVRVWKKFHYGPTHNHMRDAIPALVRRALGRRPVGDTLWQDEFWAVKDVSFTVRPGEALGIIGPNGAGKSTILKLLTGIMRPNAGRCTIKGRIGALIEVTAGFHPDLSGRDNIYLQGVIMGMPRREITRKFHEIVEFAELAPFLDMPLKRYSTGMQARLGFAIAAHLEPDVLLVDEALAVGDNAFQERALQKIDSLIRREIPVVMVTHEVEMVATLCTHAILLVRGQVLRAGSPPECLEAYEAHLAARQDPAQGA